jgi:hypothetical protein
MQKLQIYLNDLFLGDCSGAQQGAHTSEANSLTVFNGRRQIELPRNPEIAVDIIWAPQTPGAADARRRR